ncbi:HopJ type III effector protein [Caballeronia temeraria]|uniref:HopJ type III effector protein n=1 Tax=Caballeronia temeraria TaxID=1777137 RepID=A0A158DJA4_9BURK|nr:HopJ type III effector protein [Caballeronia temeraria]SAK94722.1 HopJ type III effector protein [Caballeronia temeraria]
MQLNELLEQIKNRPETITIEEVLKVIAENYDFTPVSFTNGEVQYHAGQNVKTCQLLAFAKLHALTEPQTLSCYGTFYRVDVLENPAGKDHEPIRNFMQHGWKGVRFASEALKRKN